MTKDEDQPGSEQNNQAATNQQQVMMRSGYNSHQKFNTDINQHLSDASLNANLNSLDFSRLRIQLQSVLEFAKEGDAADPFSLLRNFEQALGKSTNLNYAMFSVPLFQDMVEHLLTHCKEHGAELAN